MNVTHTLLSGSTVDIDAPFELGPRSTNFVVAATENGTRQLGSGRLEFGQAVARDVLEIAQFDEEYAFQGGTLRLGSGELVYPISGYVAKRQAAVWEGIEFSLKVSMFEQTYVDLIALLDLFIFSEKETGLTLTPRDSTLTRFADGLHPPHLLKEVPDLGLLDIRQLTAQTEKRLPRWRGRTVRGGELYVEDAGTDACLFYLVGDSAFTTIQPLPERGVPESRTLDHVSDVQIEWIA